MQAVKGYLSNGRFTPTDGTILPNHTQAVLIIEEETAKPKKPQEAFLKEFNKNLKEAKLEDKQLRQEWLNRLRQARQLAANEPMPHFPPRTPMGEPHGLTD